MSCGIFWHCPLLNACHVSLQVSTGHCVIREPNLCRGLPSHLHKANRAKFFRPEINNVCRWPKYCHSYRLFFEFGQFPLRRTVKVVGKVYSSLCTLCTLSLEHEKNASTLAKPCFVEKNIIFLDQDILQNLFNLVLLMKNYRLNGLLCFVCVLHEPVTIQGRHGMEEVICIKRR